MKTIIGMRNPSNRRGAEERREARTRKRGAGFGAGALWMTALAGVSVLLSVAAAPASRATPASSGASADSVAVDTGYLKAGGSLFDEKCSTCHQMNGTGVPSTFPPLAGNPNLKDLALIVTTVHGGHSGKIEVNGKTFNQTMPAIGADFTALEIAQVATYIRNSWGNSFGGVDLAAVKKILDPSSGKTATSEAKPPVDGALLKKGESLFNTKCATCHQKTGKGVPGTFPPLADNANLSSDVLIVTTVHGGHSGKIQVNGKTFDQTMPAIGADFSPEQLAAVATYVRNSWGNDFGGVSAARAKKILSASSGK